MVRSGRQATIRRMQPTQGGAETDDSLYAGVAVATGQLRYGRNEDALAERCVSLNARKGWIPGVRSA